MKKILAFILALILLFSATSCTAFSRIGGDYRFINETLGNPPVFNEDESFDVVFHDEIKEYIDKLFSKCEEIADSGSYLRFSALVTIFNVLTYCLYYVNDQASLCYIEMSLHTDDPAPAAEYTEINAYCIASSARMSRLYKKLYESPFSALFFSAWTEEQIDSFLKTADLYTDEFLLLLTEQQALITEYTAINESDPDYNEKTAALYQRIVRKNREIADCTGYENYPLFAYENIYMRDYTPAETEVLQRYMRDYLIPLAKAVKKNASSADYIAIGMGEHYSDPKEVYTLLEGYYDRLKGTGKKILSEDWAKHCYYTASDTSAPVAFTTYFGYYGHPVCYFGPDTDLLATYVHEQGHYNAFTSMHNVAMSVDLCEVHSQGNEWLYTAYLAQTETDGVDGAVNYMLYGQITTFVMSLTCDAYEQYVYAHPELSAEDYDVAFITVSKEIGSYDFLYDLIGEKMQDYWHRAIVASSLYYVSYAVSQIPAIELYVHAMTDGFDSAADKYKALLSVNYDSNLVQSLTDAGLHSPFDEQVYQEIYRYFTEN